MQTSTTATPEITDTKDAQWKAQAEGPHWNAQVQGLSAPDAAVGFLGIIGVLLLWSLLRAQGRNRKLLAKMADLRIELERKKA